MFLIPGKSRKQSLFLWMAFRMWSEMQGNHHLEQLCQLQRSFLKGKFWPLASRIVKVAKSLQLLAFCIRLYYRWIIYCSKQEFQVDINTKLFGRQLPYYILLKASDTHVLEYARIVSLFGNSCHCRAIALSAATRGVLDRRTAFALKPALDQIGSVLEEVRLISLVWVG